MRHRTGGRGQPESLGLVIDVRKRSARPDVGDRSFGIDAHGVDILTPVGRGLSQLAADVVVGDRDLLDVAVAQMGLELAVRDGLDLLVLA